VVTRLEDGELVAVQAVVEPAPRALHHRFSPSRGPRGPEEAPDLAHHQEWTIGMQRPKLEVGLCAVAEAADKRGQEK
jgi:hypothetical protein